jgi:hypothetical protein
MLATANTQARKYAAPRRFLDPRFREGDDSDDRTMVTMVRMVTIVTIFIGGNEAVDS